MATDADASVAFDLKLIAHGHGIDATGADIHAYRGRIQAGGMVADAH
ncbi:hypothetical protein [Stenotrophomonas panacihumi]|nr:hypothetical protein [Stenotrophomonas panacihumi]